jgi:hypothetical protein
MNPTFSRRRRCERYANIPCFTEIAGDRSRAISRIAVGGIANNDGDSCSCDLIDMRNQKEATADKGPNRNGRDRDLTWGHHLKISYYGLLWIFL